MRVTLLHNPGAGLKRGGRRPTADSLCRQLSARGFDVTYVSTEDDDAKRRTRKTTVLGAAAGGDATVAHAARWLAGRGTPLAILPLGGSNNIATSLGVTGATRDLIAAWDPSRTRPLDVGRIRARGMKSRKFVEGIGLGWFASVLRDAEERERSSVRRTQRTNAWRRTAELLDATEGGDWHITADGRDFSGRWVAIEMMNISMIGSNIMLAPRARPGDGKVDLILIGARERETLRDYLEARRNGDEPRLTLPIHRCSRVTIARHGSTRAAANLHVDDRVLEATKSIEVIGSEGQVDVVTIR